MSGTGTSGSPDGADDPERQALHYARQALALVLERPGCSLVVICLDHAVALLAGRVAAADRVPGTAAPGG